MQAVVYSLAVEPDLDPVVGAPPWSVLARQLPRLVVQTLNEFSPEGGVGLGGGGRDDRGIRFFPFLGMNEGKRGFLEFTDRLPIETVCKVHGQDPAPQIAIDGLLERDTLKVRIIDVERQKVLAEPEVPFSPTEVWPSVQRLHFEITSALGWTDPPPKPPTFEGVGFSWWLVARDEQLALEAKLIRPQPDASLQGIRAAFQSAPDAPEVRSTLVELCRLLLVHGLAREEVAGLCREAFGSVAGEPEYAEKLAAIVEAAGDPDGARPLWQEIVRSRPVRFEATKRHVAHLYAAEEYAEGCEILRAAIDDGISLTDEQRDELTAQLLAFYEAGHDVQGRDETADRMLERADAGPALRPGPARLLASVMTARGLHDAALRVAQAAVAENTNHAGLWLEIGRAYLGLGQADDARDALARVNSNGVSKPAVAEAQRLAQLVGEDGSLLHRIRAIDARLAQGDTRGALTDARKLKREFPKAPESWLFLGLARQRCGKPMLARRAYRQAIALDPDCGEAHNRLGALLAVAGRDQEAVEHLRRAIETMPDEWSPRLHYAQVAWHMGERRASMEAFVLADRLGAPEGKVAEAMRTCGADPDLLDDEG